MSAGDKGFRGQRWVLVVVQGLLVVGSKELCVGTETLDQYDAIVWTQGIPNTGLIGIASFQFPMYCSMCGMGLLCAPPLTLSLKYICMLRLYM